MKYFGTFIIGMLTLLALTGSALAAGDSQAGKAVYDAKCKMCHGADGKGNANIAKAMNVTIPDLTSKETQNKKDDELKKQITDGGGKMKPVKLTDQQVADTIAFVRSLAKS